MSFDFKRWSNSSLTTIQMCAHKFRLKHLDNIKRQFGYSAKRGIAVHHVAKESHKRQMIQLGTLHGYSEMNEAPGTERSIEEAKDIAAKEFEKAVSWGVAALSDSEKEIGDEAAVKAHNKDAAVALSALYVKEVAPSILPVAVEHKIEIHPKNMDITIQGYLDLVENDEGDVIRDLKTTEKAPFKDAAKNSQQLTMYNMIRLAETRKMPRESRLVHLVRTPKTHEESIIVQATNRDLEDVQRLVARIQVAVEAVTKGVFVPADPSAPGSPCQWCEYSDGTCKYVRRRKQ